MTDQAMQKAKILIIDDSKFLSTIYSQQFIEFGYDVILAADGEEGIQKAKNENPSLILLDGVLPKKSGFEVLEEIKKGQDTKNIPVVVLSNLEDDMEKWKQLGAVDYLIKADLSIEELTDKIKKYLS